MDGKWHVTGDYLVEIWFQIEKDHSGYPKSKNWEQLLAHPVRESVDYFEIESIPFFLKNISRGDIVKAIATRNPEVDQQEIFQFECVVDRGGHNTYRLLLRKKCPDDPTATETELLEKGLAVELENGGLFAIDASPNLDQQLIDDYLVSESKAGRWELQDGYLHTIKTTQGTRK